VVPKSKTRRKAREPAPEKKPPQRRGAAAPPQGNGTRHAEDDDEMEDQPDEQDATPNAHPQSQPQMIALPFSDTPIINRNKEFRKKGGAGAGGRRSSLGMRGRRASSLIENGQSALPHREIDPAEFHKYIAPEGLSEPRRMKQLLIWCGERALSEKPPHGSRGSSAILGGEWTGGKNMNGVDHALTCLNSPRDTRPAPQGLWRALRVLRLVLPRGRAQAAHPRGPAAQSAQRRLRHQDCHAPGQD